MNEREKFNAEVETRMKKFSETLTNLQMKADKRNNASPNFDSIFSKTNEKFKQTAQKFNDFQSQGSEEWETRKNELNKYMDEIDNDLREALSFFH